MVSTSGTQEIRGTSLGRGIYIVKNSLKYHQYPLKIFQIKVKNMANN